MCSTPFDVIGYRQGHNLWKNSLGIFGESPLRIVLYVDGSSCRRFQPQPRDKWEERMIDSTRTSRKTLIMEFCQAEARRHQQEPDDIQSEVYARMWAILELPPVDQEESDRWRAQVIRVAAGLRKREQRAQRKESPTTPEQREDDNTRKREQRAPRKGSLSKPVVWERSASAVDQPEFAAEFNEGIAAIGSDAGPIDSLVLDYLLGKQPSAKQSDIARELGVSPKTISKHKVRLENRILAHTRSKDDA